MAKPRLLHEETYVKPGLKVKATHLPTLPHIPPVFKVTEVFIRKAGAQEVNGKRREYQDLRVYLEEI